MEKSKKRQMDQDDSDIEFQEDKISCGKRRRRGTDNATPSADKESQLEGAFATWGRGDDDMEPSTKMLRMLELLKTWETAGDKTIIYSQCMMFSSITVSPVDRCCLGTSMLDLIERIFSRHGIRTLRFDGSMNRAARDLTLANFKQFCGPKVMLIR